MAKILITGASGFVGSFLVREAIKRGLETYAGIRASSSKDLLPTEGVRYCIIDFDDPKSLESILLEHQFDYIIHNAGVTRTHKNSIYMKVNVDYSVLLAELAIKTIPTLKKYVYTSSIESHGSADPTLNGVLDENTVPAPRTTYGLSKLRAEEALKKIPNLPLLIMRPTAVFGPGEKDFFLVFEMIKKYRFTPISGSKNIKYTFIYVKDLARVMLEATLSEYVNKSYFISDGRIYKITQFTDGISKALNVKTFGFTIPFPILSLIVTGTGILDKITGSKSLLNDEQLAKMKARNWDCDIAPLVQDFSFQPQYNIDQATKETALWYLEKGWL